MSFLEASSPTSRRPSGVTALGVFFAFGTCACVAAGWLLLFPGSPLDAAWRINPRGHEGFLRMGGWALLLLAIVGTACAAAAIGLSRNARWGYRLAIGILGVNCVGDAFNAVAAHDPRSWIGVPIALALIVYLIRQARRRASA